MMHLKISSLVMGTAAALLCATNASADVFNISQPSHAIVDNKTDVYPAGGADNSNTFHTGYIYNIFGATNPGVEGTGDMIFADGHTTDFVDFETATPVSLSSVALTVGAESPGSNGPRGVLSWTFQEFTDNTFTTPASALFTFSNSATTPTDTAMTLATPITNGKYFEIKMTTNSTYQNGGVRVHSLVGNAVPEPASLALFGLGGLGLLARRRQS